MKKLLAIISVIFLFSASSCRKCYICTCTNPDELFGCEVEGEQLELCDEGLIGKSVLQTRILQRESEGYTCTLK